MYFNSKATFGFVLVCLTFEATFSKELSGLESSSQLWWGARPPLPPRFIDTITNASARIGDSAFLSCTVEHLGDRSVTWMRQRDLHILTAGVFTYSADDRFRVLHPENSDEWTLEIRYVTHRDAGIYECQVNSDPKISRRVYLAVKEQHSQLDDPGMLMETTDPRFPEYNFGNSDSYNDIYYKKYDKRNHEEKKKNGRRRGRRRKATVVSIEGLKERFIQEGSVLALTCTVHHPPHRAPNHLLWFHGRQHLDYDTPRGGVSVQTEKQKRRTVSKMMMSTVTQADSGEYSCSPTDLTPDVVTVHVQNGQHHAAVHQSGLSGAEVTSLSVALSALLLIMVLSCSAWPPQG